MIPTIGLMVGGYIMMRSLDVCARKDESFRNKGYAAVIRIWSILLMFFTIACCLDLITSGAKVAIQATP